MVGGSGRLFCRRKQPAGNLNIILKSKVKMVRFCNNVVITIKYKYISVVVCCCITHHQEQGTLF